MVSDKETDYDKEQYPHAEDRYKQLEDRLSAMEIQNVRAGLRRSRSILWGGNSP